jgi:hypothetical protein
MCKLCHRNSLKPSEFPSFLRPSIRTYAIWLCLNQMRTYAPAFLSSLGPQMAHSSVESQKSSLDPFYNIFFPLLWTPLFCIVSPMALICPWHHISGISWWLLLTWGKCSDLALFTWAYSSQTLTGTFSVLGVYIWWNTTRKTAWGQKTRLSDLETVCCLLCKPHNILLNILAFFMFQALC